MAGVALDELGASSRAIRTGDSRLTRSARPICSCVNPSRRPDAGQPGVGDQDVDLARCLEQPQRLALLGEVADNGAVAVARQRGGQLLELWRLARAQDQGRRPSLRAPRRSPARGRRSRPVSRAVLPFRSTGRNLDEPAHGGRRRPSLTRVIRRVLLAAVASICVAAPAHAAVLEAEDVLPPGPERLRLDRRGRVGHRLAAPHRPGRALQLVRLQVADVRPAGDDGVPAAGRGDRPRRLRRPRDHRRERLRRLVGGRLRGRPGPAVPARALPPRDQRPAGGDPRLDLPRRRPDRPPRLLHRRRDRLDGRRDPGRTAQPGRGLPRRDQRLDRARLRPRAPPTCRASSSPSAPCRSTRGRCATAPASASSSPAPCPRATGASSPTPATWRRSGPRTSTRCSRFTHRARASPCRARRASSPPSPAAPAATSGSGSGASRRFLARTDLSAATDTATQIPVQTKLAGAPGAGLAAILPHGGSFMWAIQDPERGRAYLFNGPQLGFSIPELFVEFELHSPAQPNLRGVSAAGRAAGRDRPQRPPRLGLHVGPLRRGRPLRREADRAGDLSLQRQAAADGLPRRGLRLQHAGDRPARPDHRPRRPVGHRHAADLPHRPRAGPDDRRRGRARAPLRDLGPRAGDDRRPDRAQRRDHGPRRSTGDAPGDLERERDRRRRPRQHRLLAPGAAPAATAALGRAASVSGRRPRRVARPAAARAHAARDRSRAGLARELEQPALGRLDERRLRGARAARRATAPGADPAVAGRERRRGPELRRARPRSPRPPGTTAQQFPFFDRRRLERARHVCHRPAPTA